MIDASRVPARLAKVPELRETTYSVSLRGFTRSFEFSFHPAFLPVLVLTGRLLFGFYFLWAGLSKVIHDGHWVGLSYFKDGELLFFLGTSTGPLKSVFVDWSQSSTALSVIAPLVIVGQVMLGVGLLLGILTRLSLFFAGTMMFVFYLVHLWPANNPFLSEHIFYIGIFAVLGALGAGRVLGGDALIEKLPFVRNHPWQRWILG